MSVYIYVCVTYSLLNLTWNTFLSFELSPKEMGRSQLHNYTILCNHCCTKNTINCNVYKTLFVETKYENNWICCLRFKNLMFYILYISFISKREMYWFVSSLYWYLCILNMLIMCWVHNTNCQKLLKKVKVLMKVLSLSYGFTKCRLCFLFLHYLSVESKKCFRHLAPRTW